MSKISFIYPAHYRTPIFFQMPKKDTFHDKHFILLSYKEIELIKAIVVKYNIS